MVRLRPSHCGRPVRGSAGGPRTARPFPASSSTAGSAGRQRRLARAERRGCAERWPHRSSAVPWCGTMRAGSGTHGRRSRGRTRRRSVLWQPECPAWCPPSGWACVPSPIPGRRANRAPRGVRRRLRFGHPAPRPTATARCHRRRRGESCSCWGSRRRQPTLMPPVIRPP